MMDDLYVANLEKGLVVRVPILEGGEASEPQMIVEGHYGPDGIAVDNYSRIHAALCIQSKLISIDPSTGEITELSTRLDHVGVTAVPPIAAIVAATNSAAEG